MALPQPAPIFPNADRDPPGRSAALVESYRRLAEVFHHVLSEQSLDSLLDRIADTLDELVPYDALHIYEADENDRSLVPVLARSEWAEEILSNNVPFGEGITGWAVARRQSVLSNRAHLDPRVAFVPGTPPDPEALISVPLVARGSLKGALNIYRIGEAAQFDSDEFELAKWFGDAAALALDNAQVRAQLEFQAQTDSLTGLYNHRYFHERLRAELTRANRARDSVALIMFDIDEFKRVNDICGHAVGDQILIALSETARAIVRASDVVCRLGGEEFAVIMPSCDAASAMGLARRLMHRLERRPIDAAGEVTLSIGVAQGPDHAMNPRELVVCAESAMMTAKARGKNQVVVFDATSVERPQVLRDASDIRSIAHLKMLQSLAGRLSRLNDVREIGEAIVSELRMLIDYHTCRVYAVEVGEVRPIAYRGDLGALDGSDMAPPAVKVGQGIAGHVAATGRSLLVPDALSCEHTMQIPGTAPIDESILAVPLRYGSRVIGIVLLSKLGLDQFDGDDVRLLEVLAGQASVALENARLYEAVRREAENAKAWLEFADAISQADSFEEIASKAVGVVARLLDVEQCSLWLEHQETSDFRCAAQVGYPDLEGGPVTVNPVDTSAALEIASRRRSFLMSARELRQGFWPHAPDGALRACAIAPLSPGFGVRGWLTVRDAGDDIKHFTDERLRLLEGLAYRASVALEKASLHRHQRETAEVASALLECARELATAGGQQDVLERVTAMASRMLSGPRSYVIVESESGDVIEIVAAHGANAGIGPAFPIAEVLRLVDSSEPVVLRPEDMRGVPGAEDASVPVAVARLALSGSRLGYLVVAAADAEHVFGDRKLKLLAGIADQATLALSRY